MIKEELVETNEFQTKITKELLEQYPDEVQEWFMDAITTVPYIKWLISPTRTRAKDLPKDDKGRIIVNLEEPHIIEDADYFRQAAIHFEKFGCYTTLRPNSNPQSEYRKFWKEELRRVREGYVRESDGEWVTGFCYWYMNYNPMIVNYIEPGKRKAVRKEGMPFFFEGCYLRFHYLWQAREEGSHAIELAKRGASKSYSLSAIMTHNLVVGESEESKKRITTVLTAYEKEYLRDDKDGTFSKFKPSLDFIRTNTQFPRLLTKESSGDMTWTMGYKKSDGTVGGSRNQVMGVSAKDNPAKLRGKRGWILYEEMGSFKGLLELYDTTRKSVEDGDYVFACMYLVGTAGNKDSDFQSAKTLLYHPDGYNIKKIRNVYDKINNGHTDFGFFFPAYMNRAGCYNHDGVSDVVKALLQIYMARYKAKYGADPQSVIRVIAEDPVTPAEAIVKVKAAYFPTADINEQLNFIDSHPRFYDDTYIGELVFGSDKRSVKFIPTADTPIREYGVSNDTQGALEIYQMPVKNSQGEIPYGRYIIGHDPVDNDQAESSSLSSTFVFDLLTDEIVAEYTGRKPFAEDNYEVVRRLCIFYNARCLYEAHPYDQTVYTPNGIKKWEDIHIGDELFTINGETTKVVDIPVDGEDMIYRVTLADGRTVEASSNHIWAVYDSLKNRHDLVELTTEQMFNAGVINKHRKKKFYLPEASGVDYKHQDTPIDAYTMGLLLAEGAFTKFILNKVHDKQRNTVQFSSSKEDAEFYHTVVPYPLKYIGTKGCSWHITIPNIDKKLLSLGLLGTNSSTKFIPDCYMYNDRQTRLEILKGLMDGDGCAKTDGGAVFITVSRKLADDMLLLCRSLGFKAWENRPQVSEKGYKTAYRIVIATEEPIFKLPRKITRQHTYSPDSKGSKAQGYLHRTAIVSIEPIGIKKCKCVTVDREDGLYLIGDYIVTHNCNKKGLFAYFKKMNSLMYLADTPQYLRDKGLIKYTAFGSNEKGVNAIAAINNYANQLLRDWLMRPKVVLTKDSDGEDSEVERMNVYTIKSKAFLQELSVFTPEINVDRIRAMGMVMLLREETQILYQGEVNRMELEKQKDYAGDDPFFSDNYDDRYGNSKFSNFDFE